MIRDFNMHTIGKMLLIALAWCLWPAEAAAQHYPCNGPGPGERLVGMAPGGPGVAPTPLCERVDSGGTPPQAPTSSNSYAAIAWHVDAADVWVDGNYVGANHVGEQGACSSGRLRSDRRNRFRATRRGASRDRRPMPGREA